MQQAVVLVGGKGTRLGKLAGSRPKPFLDIMGKPFLDYVIAHAKCHGVRRVVLLAGHASEWISENYRCSVSDVEVDLRVEAQPMGTAGALLSAADMLDEQFLLLNGDSILNGNWSALEPALGAGYVAAVLARRVEDTSRYGTILEENGRVTAFAEKQQSGAGLINAGVYYFRRDGLLPLIKGASSMEADILPMLVAGGKASVSECQGYFLDIGLPETLALAREELAAKLRRKAVFFDRDNTLVRDDGYTHKVEDLKWLPGAPEAIKAANDMGRAVIVITNQAGIARGLYKVEDMRAFHDAMQRELRAVGAHIDGFYFCPHHPDGVVAGLGKACSCRKPETGMLDQAFSELALEKEGSVFIGDKDTDIACGSRYGLASHHYKGGSLLAFCQKAGVFAA